MKDFQSDFKARSGELKKQLVSLEESSNVLGNEQNAALHRIIRSAVIHDFELAYELAWKAGQACIKWRGNIQANTPKETFRELENMRLLTDIESFLDMVLQRNLLTHSYNPRFQVDTVRKIIQNFVPLLRQINATYQTLT